LLEPNTKLNDSLTYDITAWSLPYAYGLEAIASETLINSERVSTGTKEAKIYKDAYAYISDWGSMKDARFLSDLLKQKIKVRLANRPFTVEGNKFDRGSLIITQGDNRNNKEFLTVLNQVAQKHNTILTESQSGFVEKGKDLGSSYVSMITDTKI